MVWIIFIQFSIFPFSWEDSFELTFIFLRVETTNQVLMEHRQKPPKRIRFFRSVVSYDWVRKRHILGLVRWSGAGHDDLLRVVQASGVSSSCAFWVRPASGPASRGSFYDILCTCLPCKSKLRSRQHCVGSSASNVIGHRLVISRFWKGSVFLFFPRDLNGFW